MTCWDAEPAEADRRLAAAIERLRQAAGNHVYGEDEADLAAVVLDAARGTGRTIAVAESCTGGLLGGRLTAVPGSSEVFLGGVIAYHNEAKQTLLGVPADVLEREGAVSEAAARLMAEGAARCLGASAAVAVTGIAGPAGGTHGETGRDNLLCHVPRWARRSPPARSFPVSDTTSGSGPRSWRSICCSVGSGATGAAARR